MYPPTLRLITQEAAERDDNAEVDDEVGRVEEVCRGIPVVVIADDMRMEEEEERKDDTGPTPPNVVTAATAVEDEEEEEEEGEGAG